MVVPLRPDAIQYAVEHLKRAVTAAKKINAPLRLRVDANGLKDGFKVYLGGESAPWTRVVIKSPSRFFIQDVGPYFPRGDVWVEIRIENPTGCAAVIEYNWGRKQWRIKGL